MPDVPVRFTEPLVFADPVLRAVWMRFVEAGFFAVALFRPTVVFRAAARLGAVVRATVATRGGRVVARLATSFFAVVAVLARVGANFRAAVLVANRFVPPDADTGFFVPRAGAAFARDGFANPFMAGRVMAFPLADVPFTARPEGRVFAAAPGRRICLLRELEAMGTTLVTVAIRWTDRKHVIQGHADTPPGTRGYRRVAA